MTLKYFFYHQIFFQDSAQTEILTVFSNPKYTAWTFWNTEHEHFEILSMKLNCKYWECMDWNPRNTDVATSVFRRYCDTSWHICVDMLKLAVLSKFILCRWAFPCKWTIFLNILYQLLLSILTLNSYFVAKIQFLHRYLKFLLHNTINYDTLCDEPMIQ